MLKDFFKKLKCKFFMCCKVSFNEALEKLEDIVEETIEESIEDNKKVLRKCSSV